MYTVYNILLNFVFIISFPYLLLRAVLGKHGINERMGRLPQEKKASLLSGKVIWFHAASVGEVKALSTIIPQVKKDHPEYALVVSTLTKSGKKEAERILKEIKFVFFLPVDLKRFVRKALNEIKPTALILVETELWPNLIREAKRRRSFVGLINGRISETSQRKYLVAKNLFSETVSYIDLLCMQSEEHKERMILLGGNPNKIKVTGNLKFDRLLYATQSIHKDELKNKLAIPDHFKVIIGGSIRAGEERILINVFERLKQKNNKLLFILAPRHLDRVKEIERILFDGGMNYIRKSKLDIKTPLNDQSLILLDTMGELSQLYALADVAFVGGSLVPVGGHNLLEPAIYGVPVLFGPYIDNFKEEAKILIQSGGGIKVKDEAELYLNLSSLLSDDEKRRKLGEKAKEAIQKETGASQRTTDLIFSLLENHRRQSAVGSPPRNANVRRTADGGRRTLWILTIFSWLYRLGCAIRLFLYRCGVRQEKRLGAKVISVGNITVGGTGKTPLVIYLAEKLKERNKKVAILSRGYKRKNKKMLELTQKTRDEFTWEDVGDEPYLISQRLSDVPIIVSKHRNISGQYAIEKYGTQILILDDGFQHLRLFRNLDIVVIDAVNPFGNGKFLPVGRLREPLSSLKRADVYILTKTDQVSKVSELIDTLKKYNSHAPVVESIYKIRSMENLFDGSSVNLKDVENKKALVFSGIGNPLSFENSLKPLKIRTLKHQRFRDHYPYRQNDILHLIDQANSLRADFIVTTEKDSVRIPLIKEQEIPIYVLKIEIKITNGEEILLKKIEGK
jgi:3-deoxy-D-manno-octulosonic-acid transferase